MRYLVWVLALCVACGGDGAGEGDGSDTDGTFPIDADLCDEIPPYDLPSLSCDQLLNAFESTMDAAAACNTAADCQALSGQCQQMRNECFYPVNSCVDASTVGEFVSAFASCVGDDICDCQPAPDVDCVQGSCVFL